MWSQLLHWYLKLHTTYKLLMLLLWVEWRMWTFVQTQQTVFIHSWGAQQRSENNDHPFNIGHISITLTFGKCVCVCVWARVRGEKGQILSLSLSLSVISLKSMSCALLLLFFSPSPSSSVYLLVFICLLANKKTPKKTMRHKVCPDPFLQHGGTRKDPLHPLLAQNQKTGEYQGRTIIY